MEEQYGTKTVERPPVSIVDDDESVRESLPDLVRELGFAAQVFSSAEEFLSFDCADETNCLILDIMMLCQLRAIGQEKCTTSSGNTGN